MVPRDGEEICVLLRKGGEGGDYDRGIRIGMEVGVK
jgi:hypothetical protein